MVIVVIVVIVVIIVIVVIVIIVVIVVIVGLLLADGAPTVGGGKTFWRVNSICLRKQL